MNAPRHAPPRHAARVAGHGALEGSETMKRASYRDGIAWIALNYETSETDVDTIAADITACLLADLFGVDVQRVAADVARYRSKVQG